MGNARPLHPFNLRWIAEDLVRLRRADDRDRYAASQRGARIDPNPHQIDAVIFALRRRPTRAASSRTRSSLGVTIEAGLVVAGSFLAGLVVLGVQPVPPETGRCRTGDSVEQRGIAIDASPG